MNTKLQTFSFNGDVIEVTLDKYVAIKSICKAIGLKYETQFSKLKSDPTYEAKLLKVQTSGGVQEVFCIPLDKLNGWLFSINPNKTKPEVREKLIRYKQECFRVLYEHFNKNARLKPTYPQLNNTIKGYKGQISKKNIEIAQLKAKIAQLQDPDVIASTVARAIREAQEYKHIKQIINKE